MTFQPNVADLGSEYVDAFRADFYRFFPFTFLMPAAVFAGLARAWAPNPLGKKGYSNWLLNVPWTAEKPLPFGRIRLSATDWIVLVLVVSPSFLFPWPIAWKTISSVIISFLVSYVFCLLLPLRLAGLKVRAYLVAAMLFLNVALFNRPFIQISVMAVIYSMAIAGLPTFKNWLASRRHQDTKRTDKTVQTNIYDIVPRNLHSMSLTDSIGIPLFIAWCTTCLFSISIRIRPVPVDEQFLAAGIIIAMSGFVCAVIRLGAYCAENWPPLSIWARICTGRMIVPGYDKVFIAPLIVLLTAFCLNAFCLTFRDIGVSPLVFTFAGLGSVGLLAVFLPPELEQWKMTGQHRLVRQWTTK